MLSTPDMMVSTNVQLSFVVCLSLSTIKVAQEVPTGTVAPRSPDRVNSDREEAAPENCLVDRRDRRPGGHCKEITCGRPRQTQAQPFVSEE